MSRQPAILLALVVFAAAASAQQTTREIRTLVLDNSHVVSYEKRGDRLVLTLEMIADFTNDRKPARYQDMDFASFRIDMNNNQKVDRNIDIAFGQRSYTDLICTQYLRHATAASVCGELPSRASMHISFAKSAFADTAHPIFEFSIPISELSVHSKVIGFDFMFHSAGKGFSFYPASASVTHSFRETLPLDLDRL